jgi:hypothetical protein
MITLKNLKRIGDIIEADYYVVTHPEPGHISVDISSGKVVNHTLIPEYGSCDAELYYAKWFITTYLTDKYEFDDKYVVEWY